MQFSDDTEVAGKKWRLLKGVAMLENYQENALIKKMIRRDQMLLAELRKW